MKFWKISESVLISQLQHTTRFLFPEILTLDHFFFFFNSFFPYKALQPTIRSVSQILSCAMCWVGVQGRATVMNRIATCLAFVSLWSLEGDSRWPD